MIFLCCFKLIVTENAAVSSCSCANVALKLNAKLSNSLTNGRAWKMDYENPRVRDGLPWVAEAPTLVLGLSTAKSKILCGLSVRVEKHTSLTLTCAPSL